MPSARTASSRGERPPDNNEETPHRRARQPPVAVAHEARRDVKVAGSKAAACSRQPDRRSRSTVIGDLRDQQRQMDNVFPTDGVFDANGEVRSKRTARPGHVVLV